MRLMFQPTSIVYFRMLAKGGAEFFCFVEEEHGRMESEPLSGLRRDWGCAVYLYKAGLSLGCQSTNAD